MPSLNNGPYLGPQLGPLFGYCSCLVRWAIWAYVPPPAGCDTVSHAGSHLPWNGRARNGYDRPVLGDFDEAGDAVIDLLWAEVLLLGQPLCRLANGVWRTGRAWAGSPRSPRRPLEPPTRTPPYSHAAQSAHRSSACSRTVRVASSRRSGAGGVLVQDAADHDADLGPGTLPDRPVDRLALLPGEAASATTA